MSESIQKQKVQGWPVAALVCIFIQGVVYISFSTESKQDNWIVALCSALVIVPMVAVYLRIYKLNPEKNLFEVLDALLGKLGGKIGSALFMLYALCLSALSIRNFTDFVRILMLENTPILYVTAFYCFLCLYLMRSGMGVLAKYSMFVLPYIAIIALITLAASFDVMEIKNLLPILGQPLPVLAEESSVMSLITFGQVFMLLGLLPMQKGETGRGKAVWLAYACATLYILVTLMRAIMLLGGEAYSGFFYQIYASYSMLHFGDFITHLEPLVSGCIIAMILVRTTVFLRLTSIGASRLINSANELVFALPIAAICAALSIVLYHQSSDKIYMDKLFRWVSAFFLIVAPLILWLVSEVRKKRGVKNG